MKVICITGTPGTGKTTIAKKLAKKLNLYYIDVNKLISKYKLSEGYDRKRKTKVVDVNKLNKFLIKMIKNINQKPENAFNSVFFKNKVIEFAPLSKARSTNTLKNLNIKKKSNKIYKKIKGIIIDSNLSHYLPKKYVDMCIVLKCDIKELNKRLKRKRFHQSKIQENLQAEIFDVCRNEAIELKHNVLVVGTSKGFNIKDFYKKLNQ